MNKYTKTLKIKQHTVTYLHNKLFSMNIVFYMQEEPKYIRFLKKNPEILYFICLKQKIQTHTQFSTKSSRHWFILQTVQNVVDCQIDHFQSRFSCGRPDMGRQENIG